MIPFLAAQAHDPFKPALMLIQADDLEGSGDLAGAKQLRALVAAGFPSIAMIALSFCDDMPIHLPDREQQSGIGCGIVDAFGFTSGSGDGFGDFGSGGRSRTSDGRDGIGDGHWYKEDDFSEFRRGAFHE